MVSRNVLEKDTSSEIASLDMSLPIPVQVMLLFLQELLLQFMELLQTIGTIKTQEIIFIVQEMAICIPFVIANKKM
jgi:hypothetical protein